MVFQIENVCEKACEELKVEFDAIKSTKKII
jgi:hypothetical protein